MKRVPLWILAATLGSFAAGMNVGLAVPKVLAAGARVPTPDDIYVGDLVDRYGLTAAQQRSLRLVLQSARDEEIAIYTGAEASRLPPDIRREVLAVRSRTEQRIRALLDEEQRARFDADSRPRDGR